MKPKLSISALNKVEANLVITAIAGYYVISTGTTRAG